MMSGFSIGSRVLPPRRLWLVMGLLAACWPVIAADPPPRRPSFETVRQLVEEYFATIEDQQPTDIIARSQVADLFQQLRALGWTCPDEKDVLADTLPDGDFLVQAFRTPQGRRFLQQVAGYELIYDRLDRLARQPGGEQLMKDLPKLPDAARYAPLKPHVGAPSLIDFLPKNASGRRPHVPDYRKPTGRIYTVDVLIRRLQPSPQPLQRAPPSGRADSRTTISPAAPPRS